MVKTESQHEILRILATMIATLSLALGAFREFEGPWLTSNETWNWVGSLSIQFLALIVAFMMANKERWQRFGWHCAGALVTVALMIGTLREINLVWPSFEQNRWLGFTYIAITLMLLCVLWLHSFSRIWHWIFGTTDDSGLY